MNKLLFFLLLIFIPGLAEAAVTPDYYIVLGTETQAAIMNHIITSLNVFFGYDATVATTAVRYYKMLEFVVILGVAGALVRLTLGSLGGGAGIAAKGYVIYLLSVVFILGIAYGPTSVVMVQTKHNTTYSVHTLPMLMAFTFSAFTTLQKELNDMSESAFNIPNPTDNVFVEGASEGLGYAGGEIELARAYKTATFGTERELSSQWDAYVRDCFLLPASAQPGGDKLLTTLFSSTNIRSDLNPTQTGFGEELVTWNGHTGRCKDFWNDNGASTTAFDLSYSGLDSAIQKFEDNVTSTGRYNKLGGALGYLGALVADNNNIPSAAAIKSAVSQAVLSNEYSSTFRSMGIAGQVMADGAEQANADVQLNGIASGLYMAEQLPMTAFLVFALMMSAFPFVLAFALLPGALKVLMNYSQTLLWISLWGPMANILGIFLDFRFDQLAQQYMYGVDPNGVLSLTPDKFIDVSSEAASIAGLAGYLFIAVGALSWMLVTGSGQMLGNMMSSFSGAFQNRANADSQLANSEEMRKTGLLSAEMGESISQREMLQYESNMRAGDAAGATGGMMHSFGRNGSVGAITSSHTGAVNGAVGMGESIAKAEKLGNGGMGNNAGRIQGAKAGASYGAEASTLGSEEKAAKVGANNAVNQTMEAQSSSDAFQENLDTNGEKSMRTTKSVDARTKQVGATNALKATQQETGGGTLDDTANNVVSANSTKTAEGQSGDIKRISKEGGATEAVHHAASIGEDKGRDNIATSGAIEQNIDRHGEKNVASAKLLSQMQNHEVKTASVEKHAAQKKQTTEQATEDIADDASTKTAQDTTSLDSSIDHQGGSVGAVSNASAMGGLQGEDIKVSADAVRQVGPKALAEQKQKNSGSSNLNTARVVAHKGEAAAQAEESKKDLERKENRLQKFKDQHAVANATPDEIKQKEKEIEQLEQNLQHELEGGGTTSDGAEIDVEAVNTQLNDMKAELANMKGGSMAGLSPEDQDRYDALQGDVAEAKQVHQNDEKFLKSFEGEGRAQSEVTRNATTSTEDNKTSRSSMIDQKLKNTALEAEAKKLEESGIDLASLGEQIGEQRAFEKAGDYAGTKITAEKTVEAFIAHDKNGTGMALAQTSGVDVNDVVELAQFAQSLDTGVKINTGAGEMKMIMDADGNIVASSRNAQHTFSVGSKGDFNVVQSATLSQVETTTDDTTLKLTMGASKATEFATGWLTAKAAKGGSTPKPDSSVGNKVKMTQKGDVLTVKPSNSSSGAGKSENFG